MKRTTSFFKPKPELTEEQKKAAAQVIAEAKKELQKIPYTTEIHITKTL